MLDDTLEARERDDPLAAALALFAVRLVQTPPAQILPTALGSSAVACLASITALSAPADTTPVR